MRWKKINQKKKKLAPKPATKQHMLYVDPSAENWLRDLQVWVRDADAVRNVNINQLVRVMLRHFWLMFDPRSRRPDGLSREDLLKRFNEKTHKSAWLPLDEWLQQKYEDRYEDGLTADDREGAALIAQEEAWHRQDEPSVWEKLEDAKLTIKQLRGRIQDLSERIQEIRESNKR